MTRNTKIAIGAGAAGVALLIWWLLSRKKAANADVGVSVTKTTSECDPTAPNYAGDAKCTASSDNFTPSLPDKTKEPEQSPAPVSPQTSLPPAPDPLWPRTLPGTDGPITPRLQVLANAGSRIQDPLVGKLTSARRG